MHDGKQNNMLQIIERFNKGDMPVGKDKLIQPLGLTNRQKTDLLAFLQAISAPPLEFQKPVLPD